MMIESLSADELAAIRKASENPLQFNRELLPRMPLDQLISRLVGQLDLVTLEACEIIRQIKDCGREQLCIACLSRADHFLAGMPEKKENHGDRQTL